MKSTIIFILSSLLIMSCSAQQIDLETISYDKELKLTVSNINDFKKDREIETSMYAYKTNDINKFRVNNIGLTNHKFDNVTYEEASSVYLLVDNYNTNNFIGYVLRITEEKQAANLIRYFRKKLGEPFKKREYTRKEAYYEDALYLWQSEQDKITFIKKHTEKTKDQKTNKDVKVTSAEIVVIKKGLSVTPNEDTDPEKLENLLKENPRAFELIEVFKSRFP